MDLDKLEFNRWVANFFTEKSKEYFYHLQIIVGNCEKSLDNFSRGEQDPEGLGRDLIYSFSSFTNAFMSLKDSASTFLKAKVTQSDIESLNHGAFFYRSRNAATHDGNPIISAWADGRFYVPADIKRLDHTGKIVSIPAPQCDVKSFCLEFSRDFTKLLSDKLSQEIGSPDLKGFAINLDAAEVFMKSDLVPDFAKELFNQHLPTLQDEISKVDHDPVNLSLAQLAIISCYCTSKLGTH